MSEPIPPMPEPPIIHVDLRLDPGCTALGEDLDRLNDRLINLLDHEFPRHNGLGMTVELVDEDEPKSAVPPMPELPPSLHKPGDNLYHHVNALVAWGRTLQSLLTSERAHSEALAEAIDRIRRNQSCADGDCCSQARAHERALEYAFAALAAHRERKGVVG